MQNEAVAGRYAKALLDLAIEAGKVKEYAKDLETFEEAFSKSAELRVALTNPSVPLEQRQGVAKAVIEHLKLTKIVSNFLRLLVDRGRVGILSAIVVAFSKQRDEREGRVRGKVVSAFALTPAQLKELRTVLGERLGQEVLLTEEVQPSLIGGLRVELDGKTFDGSLRNQLDRLRMTLTRASSASQG